MKSLIIILTSLLNIHSFGQNNLFQTWISPKMDYLEIGPLTSKAGFATLKEYKTKVSNNSLVLKAIHETLKFLILKCDKDSLILKTTDNTSNQFSDKKDILQFVSKTSLSNSKIVFKILNFRSREFEYHIDSSGLVNLKGNKRSSTFTGTYSGQLSKEFFDKINYYIQAADITKLPNLLPSPFDSDTFFLDVYYFHKNYNSLLHNATFGTDPPYILKDFIVFIKELPKNIRLTKLDNPD